MSKIFIDAEDLLRDSFELGLRIYESGFRPTFILGVWRGGTPVGIAIQELFEMYGQPTDHFSIRTASYGAGTTPSDHVKVFGLQHLAETINAEDKLLIIDDVFDSGRSVDAIIHRLKEKLRRNTPSDIQVATVYYKPEKNKTNRIPDFYVHETEEWLVFPHEMQGCSLEEIIARKPLPERALKLLKNVDS